MRPLRLEERLHPGKKAVPAGIFYYHIDDPVIERQGDMTPEEIEAGILKKLRMNGLVNSSLDVIRHLDREIEKESDVIPSGLKGRDHPGDPVVSGRGREAVFGPFRLRFQKPPGDGRRDPFRCRFSESLEAGPEDCLRLLPLPHICGF